MFSRLFVLSAAAATALSAPLASAPASVATTSFEFGEEPCGMVFDSKLLAGAKAKLDSAVFADEDDSYKPRAAGPLSDDPILWPNNTLIYEIDETTLTDPKWDQYLKGENKTNTQYWKEDVYRAVDLINAMAPCVTVRRRTKEDIELKRHYLRVGKYQYYNCWSDGLGYTVFDNQKDEHNTTYQRLSLFYTFERKGNPLYKNNSCGAISNAHEFLHALGVYHEQSRPDRDSFVTIFWDAMRSDLPDYAYQYRKVNISLFGTKSDYNSIMMYPNNAFLNTSTGYNYTMLTKDNNTWVRNQHEIGQGDADFLNQLYGCGIRPAPALAQFYYKEPAVGFLPQYYTVQLVDLNKKVLPVPTQSNKVVKEELCAQMCVEDSKCLSFSVAAPLNAGIQFAWCFLHAKQVTANELKPYPGWNATYYRRKTA